VEEMGRKKRFSGKVELTAEEFEKLTNLAKFGYTAQKTIAELQGQLTRMRNMYHEAKDALTKLTERTKTFIEAMREAPDTVMNYLHDILEYAKEERARKQQEIQAQKEAKLEAKLKERRRVSPQGEPPKPRTRSYDRDSR
jgi:chromosome segregation ATPase